MKIKQLLPLLFIATLFAGCSSSDDDDSKGNSGGSSSTTSANITWIDNFMRDKYYWYDEIPAASKLNYSADEETFFYSLLSNKDGKIHSGTQYPYSYIESLSSTRSTIQTDYSYGFEFTILGLSNGSYVALVQYVLDDSPAAEAGLKRGDWIIGMDNDYITASNYTNLYGSSACTFSLGVWSENEEGKYVLNLSNSININSARAVEDNPIYTYNTLNAGDKSVGYLVYNHFSRGKTDSSTEYDTELKGVSSFMNGVDEFVLDLRYNNGGLITSAHLLSSILAPADALGKTLASLEYNSKNTSSNYTYKLSVDNSTSNLNLNRLYVLTSNSTASASEIIINCLRPYMTVVVIGEQTEGKNVGSITETSTDKKWAMHPIVCKIYNSQGKSDYENGFSPDIDLHEAFGYDADGYVNTIYSLYPLGDENERLLAAALNHIEGNSTRTVDATEGISVKTLKPIVSSIERKATNSVVIDRD